MAGQRVLHVADLVTTGESAVDWVRALRGSEMAVEHYAAVFDRMQGGGDRLRQEGVAVHSLARLDRDFLELAAAGQADSIAEYLRDPEGWARRFLRRDPGFVLRHTDVSGGQVVRPEGLQVLTEGYPALVGELEGAVCEGLGRMGVEEPARLLRPAQYEASDQETPF